MNEDALNLPPFPPLQWDGYGWVGELDSPSWAGFEVRANGYATISPPERVNGCIRLFVEPGSERGHPSPEQFAALRNLLTDERGVSEAVLSAILAIYPEERAAYFEDYSEDDPDIKKVLPPVSEPSGLSPLIEPTMLLLHRIGRDGVGYVGWQFSCYWEREHGLGLLMHRNRVVDIGDAATAVSERAARRDATSERR